MKWKKLGQIFNPINHSLPNNCVEFSQSPQALVFDNFIRIYFSTRVKDKVGKYLSHISYVDMDKGLRNVLGVSANTVIELGSLGCFDEHGIFPMNVVRDKDKILAYTTGWNRRVSVSTDASIGLAISSDDGVTFEKVGKGPVLSSSLHEPFLVGDAFVSIYEGVYHMWYIHGTKWASIVSENNPDRVYKIAHASSNDGLNWNRDNHQIISDRLNTDECQALPTVVFFDDKYHMFFCYRYATDFRKNKNRAYRIGYAFSSDLVNWTRDDENVGIDVTQGEWDSDMLCYPHVFRCDDKIYMLYNGNEFGRFGFGVAELER